MNSSNAIKISAFVPTYNEEKRIRYCLQCLRWCDEIFVLDKSSTDKTVEIAKEMGAVVHVIPHEQGYDPHEFDYIKKLNGDWVVLFTCSDLIDKELALKIRESTLDTETDIIFVPFKQYVLGIEDRRSPWYSAQRRIAFRKSIININEKSVHDALDLRSDKIKLITNSGFMYHLTHESVDGMMDRHIRYWRGEASSSGEKSLKEPFKLILHNIKRDLLRGAFWHGWSLFALACAHTSYFLMLFVYIWETKCSNSTEVYQRIRESIYNQWVDNEK